MPKRQIVEKVVQELREFAQFLIADPPQDQANSASVAEMHRNRKKIKSNSEALQNALWELSRLSDSVATTALKIFGQVYLQKSFEVASEIDFRWRLYQQRGILTPDLDPEQFPLLSEVIGRIQAEKEYISLAQKANQHHLYLAEGELLAPVSFTQARYRQMEKSITPMNIVLVPPLLFGSKVEVLGKVLPWPPLEEVR